MFSFLSLDTLQRYETSFLSGIVAYNDVMLGDNARDDFEVTTHLNDFTVTFGNQYSSVPTVLAFPNWFSLGNQFYPKDATDLTFDITEINTVNFKIRYQIDDSRKSYLGFSFAVIVPDMPNENIKHGIVTECTEM